MGQLLYYYPFYSILNEMRVSHLLLGHPLGLFPFVGYNNIVYVLRYLTTVFTPFTM